MTRLPFLPRVILSRLLLWCGRRFTAGAAWVLPELFSDESITVKDLGGTTR